MGEVGPVTVKNVEVPAARPHVPGQVEPQPELAVLAQAARLQPLYFEALDDGCFAQARASGW